ncbi:MAG: N-acetylglucosamine-6-phosphate deacetylase [Coleofasciculaceae cyanobacterium SM2_1_6]|nr:N-acetylglucosamine-6-phosphate deacetylase [Coleofasciculaceae cyanobacterium SM2_1_6]
MQTDYLNYPLDIINARLPGYKGLQRVVVNAAGLITRISPMSKVRGNISPKSIDVYSSWISLGGIDLQINGALGLPFTDVQKQDINKIREICQFLWDQGVDAFLPTIVTTSITKIHQALEVFAEVRSLQAQETNTAKILGVHLEGPFLNPDKRGAHPQNYLLPLTIEQVKLVLGNYQDVVQVITLAPELDTTGAIIPYLRSMGIKVSIGHSLATAEEANLAWRQGASLVTHAFNAMSPLHHRQPGLLTSAITNPQIYCGLIADGEHVAPLMIKLLLAASDYEDGVFLVSDALAPLGLADGVYPWGQQEMEVKQGTARLPDGTLVGTTLSLLTGVRNLVKWKICPLEQAIALATIATRKAIYWSSPEEPKPHAYLGQPVNCMLRWTNTPEEGVQWSRLFNPNPSFH